MDSSKHSPTPWFAKRNGFSTVYIESRLRPGVLQEVAACGPTEAGIESQDANAAFIVRAANSHDQIVAALQRLVAANDAYAGVFAKQDDEVALMVEYGEAMEAARAALAAADA